MTAFMPSVTTMLQADTMDLTSLLALRRDLERFRLLVENSLDVVAEVAQDAELLYVSPNIRGRLGFSPSELVGRPIFDCIHPDDISAVRAQFAQPQSLAMCRFRHQDGSWQRLEISIRSFFTPEGDKHSVLIARDVAARRDVEEGQHSGSAKEEQPRPARKHNPFDRSAAGIAHDLNNIFATITVYTDLARMDSGDSRETQDYLQEVLKACERAKVLVHQIGDIRSCPNASNTLAKASARTSTPAHFPMHV
jgi:PAS domain S-box-containing protein